MNSTVIIFKNEIKNFFGSAAAYITLVVFLLITGWFFASPLFVIGQADLRSLFSTVPLIFLLFIPAITMSTIAKEKSSGTFEIVATLPITDSQIIMGKFFASVAVLTVGLIFTLVHLVTIMVLGTNIDYGAVFCGYLGLVFLGAVYSSIGIFASSLTKNQIVAFITAFIIVFFFFILEFILIFIPSSIVGIFQYLSVGYHLSNLSRGVIDTRNIVYFLSIIVLFLRLSVSTLESRKWN